MVILNSPVNKLTIPPVAKAFSCLSPFTYVGCVMKLLYTAFAYEGRAIECMEKHLRRAINQGIKVATLNNI